MLVQRQRFDVEALGFRRSFHSVAHPNVRLHVVEQRAHTVDERVLPGIARAAPPRGRCQVSLVLSGESTLFGRATVDVGPGSAFVTAGRTFTSRSDGSREPSLTVSLDWDAAHFGTRSAPRMEVGRCSVARLRPHIDDLRIAIDTAWDADGALPDVASRLARFARALRAEGFDVPLIGPADLAVDLTPTERALSRAMDAALSLAATRPTMIDISAGAAVSARSVQRHLPRLMSLWGRPPEPFRSFRNRRRLYLGALFMSHPDATTEAAAKVLGFSSPNALCRAFARHHLPSPGTLRAALARLA